MARISRRFRKWWGMTHERNRDEQRVGLFSSFPISEAAARPPLSGRSGYSKVNGTLTRFGATGTVAQDATVQYSGASSTKITTDGTVNFTDARVAVSALNGTGKWLCMAIRCADISKITELQLTYGTSGLTNRRRWGAVQGSQSNKWLANGEWQNVILPWQDGADSGTPSRASATDYQVRVQSNGLGATDIWIGEISWIDQPAAKGTIVFDDGYESVFTEAWPKLQASNVKFGISVPAEYINASGRLSLAAIQTMRASGLCEVLYHGTGNDQRVLTSAQLRALIESDLKVWKRHNIIVKGAAYPGGEEDATVDGPLIRDIYAQYFSYSMMIFQGQVEHTEPADLLRVKTRPYVTNAVTTGQVSTEISKVAANGGFSIQRYHDIVASNADLTTKYLKADFDTNVDTLSGSALLKVLPGELLA